MAGIPARVIDENTWFYDESKGLLIVHEARTIDGDYIKTDQFVIPWRTIRAALKRRDSK